jgi:hypothetical protein
VTDERTDKTAQERNWKALLAVADELERWTATMPIWSEQSWESWEDFSRRHGKRERDLAKVLGRMPGCTIIRTSNGSATTLNLGGVQVRSVGGLAGVCRDWINWVRRSAPKKPPAPK